MTASHGRDCATTTERTKVLVLMGGPDAEREVSLESGRQVAVALARSPRYAARERIIDTPDAAALRALADAAEAEIVFPALHGSWGEGGPLQSALEAAGLAYVGAGPRAAALAMDKLATKTLLAAAGVPTPEATALDADDPCPLDPPLVLKPIAEGSSVDLRICRSREEVTAARALLHPKRGRLFAERYIRGRELTVGVLSGTTLPLIEIIPAVAFYDYEAKYLRNDTRYVVEPDVPEDLHRRCMEIADLAFDRVGCRDLARVDLMVDDDGPWFLEINTMPGFTPHSLVPMAAAQRGLDMTALCEHLLDAACARRGRAGGETARAQAISSR